MSEGLSDRTSANQLANPQPSLLPPVAEIAMGWWWWWQPSAPRPPEWMGIGAAVAGSGVAEVSVVRVGEGVLTEEGEAGGPCR